MYGFDDAAGEVFGSAAADTGGGGGSSAGGLMGTGGGWDAWTSGLVNYWSAQSANRMNRANSTWAFNSALEADNTAVQRRQRDLAAAGINPILAAGQSAGSPGSPSVAPARGPGEAATAGYQSAKMASAASAKMEAEAENVTADTDLKERQMANVEADTILRGATAKEIQERTLNLVDEGRRIREDVLRIRQDVVTAKSQGEKMEKEKELIDQERRLKYVETVLNGLRIPAALNAANVESGWFKQNVSPFLHDIAEIFSTAAGAATSVAAGRFAYKGVAGNEAKHAGKHTGGATSSGGARPDASHGEPYRYRGTILPDTGEIVRRR